MCFSAAFYVTKAYFMISKFLVLRTLFNSCFAWLLRISVCDNTDYTSCLFCLTIETWSLKKKFISNVALTKLIMKRYLHGVRLWHSLSALFDLLLEPWESPMTATQLWAVLLQSSLSMLFREKLVLWNVTKPNYANFAAARNFRKATAVYSNILIEKWINEWMENFISVCIMCSV